MPQQKPEKLYNVMNYPANTFKTNISDKVITTTTIFDWNKFFLGMITVFMLFCTHLQRTILKGNYIPVYSTIVCFINLKLYFNKYIIDKKTLKKILIFILVTNTLLKFLSAALWKFTKEIASDTIYMLFFVFLTVFIVDENKCYLLTNKIDLLESEVEMPLDFENAYYYKKEVNFPTAGYTCAFLGIILLASRCKSQEESISFIYCSFITIALLPNIVNFYKLYKNYKVVALVSLLGLCYSYLTSPFLALIYFLVYYISYFLVYVFIHLHEYISRMELKCKIKF